MNLVLSTLAGLLALLALFLLVKPDNEPYTESPPPPAEQPPRPELPSPATSFITTGLGGPWPPATYCGERCRTAMTNPLDHDSRTERKSGRPSNSTNTRFTAASWDAGQFGCGSRSSIR
ncbi:hypothetical protein [Streptomyces sp. NBC_00986]|uniref:hypothetical protein n=1 Tax=Streptomyces sp. NBC_00986 TaxID=2903702 RepID=UPI003863B162|nr:hypothetical protein OG504_28230 [Streptomyces sp. NBC_00986]